MPVNKSSFAFVGGLVLRRLPAWLGNHYARQHRREWYSKSAQGQAEKGMSEVQSWASVKE
jgi:hypothetical protein